MIVRISGEAQFELSDDEAGRLNELERSVIEAVEARSEADYAAAFEALLDHVRDVGTHVPDEELEGSDVILPPSDTTLEEASKDFTGEGLIPD